MEQEQDDNRELETTDGFKEEEPPNEQSIEQSTEQVTEAFKDPSLAERLEAQRQVAVDNHPVCPYCEAKPLQFKRYEMQVENMLASIFCCAACYKVVPVQLLVLSEPMVPLGKPDPRELQRMIIRGRG
jgi:hypothetical protein